ncbi:MAG: LruC domain-containing protein [Candidatus Cloacimonadales bacterium]
MKKIFLLLLVVIITTFTFVGCSKDNSTNPNQDYNNLDIPDGFNWTNLDYIQLNISLDSITTSTKEAVVVRYKNKVLARKFLQNGRLEMNVNSVKGYDNLLVEVPAYGFSQEIATNIKEHNLVVPTNGGERFSYEANIDPYFQGEISEDTSNYVAINNFDPTMIGSFMDLKNVYLPTEVPEHNTGWHKYKFNPAGTGQVRQVQDGINNHLLIGTDWIVMQTIKVADYNYFSEYLEGAKTPNTANINQCPFNSYITNTYIFLDADMNYLNFFPWSPWTYTDTNRFFSDRTNNYLNNAEYMVIVGQYNGPQGNVKLNNWLVTLYNTETSIGDSDGDGVPDSEDAFPGDPNLAGKITVPGGVIMYEDLWPNKGDYDFNDLYVYMDDSEFMVNADNKIVYFDLYVKVMKAGAKLHNGLGVRFINAINNGSGTTYETIDNGRMLNSVVAYMLPENWSTGQPNGDWSTMTYIDKFAPNTAVIIHDVAEMDLTKGDAVQMRIYFDPNEEQPENPIPDFFLFRSNNRALEVHVAGYPPTTYADPALFGTGDDASLEYPGNWYKTTDNYPWALYFSIDKWVPAIKENIPIFRAYPDFAGWVTSGGENNKNWHTNYVYNLTENPWSD